MTSRVLARAGLVAAGVALAGAFLFGAWHVAVGGGLHGNARAAEFGLAMAAVSGGGLAALGLVARRLVASPRAR
jgi:hypothetical protein